MLKLDQPVPFSNIISPVCLPENPQDTFGRDDATIIGWGVTETGELSTFLRDVILKNQLIMYQQLNKCMIHFTGTNIHSGQYHMF